MFAGVVETQIFYITLGSKGVVRMLDLLEKIETGLFLGGRVCVKKMSVWGHFVF